MNKNIKELAEKSGFILWSDEPWNPGDVIDWSSMYDNELSLFAELVVCRTLSMVENGLLEYGIDHSNNPIWHKCVENIRKEFSTNKHHKHHDLIIEYAKGAKIQYFIHGEWRDIKNPCWTENSEYRIKP